MVLDECPKSTEDKVIISKAIDVSTHWAKRCKVEFGKDKTKHYLVLLKVVYTKIYAKKVLIN